uniref:Uncharacterized protein n=1 Tax=Xenopus tropicalis TaxID=8364 RepID=A0A1B8Y1U7_XENTR
MAERVRITRAHSLFSLSPLHEIERFERFKEILSYLQRLLGSSAIQKKTNKSLYKDYNPTSKVEEQEEEKEEEEEEAYADPYLCSIKKKIAEEIHRAQTELWISKAALTLDLPRKSAAEWKKEKKEIKARLKHLNKALQEINAAIQHCTV